MRISPKRWRWCTTSDIRPSATRVNGSSIELMRPLGDRFDHNLHALRIVEQFEQRYLDFPGLNLTFEVREGIVKHSRDYSAAEFPELAEYLLALRPPLEAQLIDLVDEIAYNTADLDDGFEARIAGSGRPGGCGAIFGEGYGEVDARYREDAGKLKFNEALKRVLDRLCDGPDRTYTLGSDRAGATSLEDIRGIRSGWRVFTAIAATGCRA